MSVSAPDGGRARRHLLLVDKGVGIDAFHRGHLSQAVQEKLLADIDARLLRLESGETDESNEQKPAPDRTDANSPTESVAQNKTTDPDNVATTFEKRNR
jgi:hypothetical protein